MAVLGRTCWRASRLLANGGAKPRWYWETNAGAQRRSGGARGYAVIDPEDDGRSDYRAIYDASGDASLLDTLIGRLAPGGEIVLAGFYSKRPSVLCLSARLHARGAHPRRGVRMAAARTLECRGQRSTIAVGPAVARRTDQRIVLRC